MVTDGMTPRPRLVPFWRENDPRVLDRIERRENRKRVGGACVAILQCPWPLRLLWRRFTLENILPPRLGAILALEPDVAFANRLRRVLESAARAISKLGELDLVKYEETLPLEDTADLSLWEELAPVVAETLANVSALIEEIDADFPEGEVAIEDRQDEVMDLIRAASSDLRGEVSHFGQRVRDPSVVGDRWNLVIELQSFRFQFRNRIGNMVFEVASRLGECQRREVEPGYDVALATTLVIRSTTADLQRLMHSRMQKVAEAAPEDVEWNVQQIDKELNAFGRTAAWRALRAQDKRVIIEFRHRLRKILTPDLTKFELLSLIEPFVEFIDGFREVNQRELLIQHDQEVQASVGVVLERAMNASRYEDQLLAFNEAIGAGQSLYGRSPEFDAFLRKLRKTPPTPQTLPEEVEQFVGLLAALTHD
jgi:hypothetical protein